MICCRIVWNGLPSDRASEDHMPAQNCVPLAVNALAVSQEAAVPLRSENRRAHY
jgi:hypothetical protein